MQPIHYSLILNLAALVAGTFLAWIFAQPLLVLVLVLVANHVVGRFPQGDGADDGPRGMGFTADLD